jgi:hypothetical protein
LPTRRALSVERQKVHAACSKGHPQREVMIQCANKLEKIMPDKDLQDELDRLRSENSALKKGASPGARMKVSEKGALSIYGMGRFPVTLYKEPLASGG